VLADQEWRRESVVGLVTGILLFFTGTLLLLQLALRTSGVADGPNGPFWNLLGGLIALQLPILILSHGCIWFHGLGWREAFGFIWNRSAFAWGIGVGLGAVAIGYPVMRVTVGWLERFGYPSEPQKAVQFLATAPAWQQASIGVFAVFLAAIAEETLFRGILYRLGRTRPQRVAALVLTSILFGAVHFNAAAFLPLTLFGGALCWAYQRTGNLLTCIIAHSTFNAVGLAVAILGPTPPSTP
jgi:membrane protease YdiL (CAAX protease family)